MKEPRFDGAFSCPLHTAVLLDKRAKNSSQEDYDIY
jgi:hypothetical protein